LEYADYQRAVWQILNKLTSEQVPERQIWRQIQFLSVIGPAALPPELLDRVSSAAAALRLSATADGIILSLRMVNVLVSWPANCTRLVSSVPVGKRHCLCSGGERSTCLCNGDSMFSVR
jgi:hypothetical protein